MSVQRWSPSLPKIEVIPQTAEQKSKSLENSIRDRLLRKSSSVDSTSGRSLPHREKSFKAQFIEIYVGSQVFEKANLNVIVAISLLASESLYEVVIVDVDSVQELRRIYVYEEELAYQMDGRLSALIVARDGPVTGNKSPTAALPTSPTNVRSAPLRSTSLPAEESPLPSIAASDSLTSPSSSQRVPQVTRRDGRSRRVSMELEHAGSSTRLVCDEAGGKSQRAADSPAEVSSGRISSQQQGLSPQQRAREARARIAEKGSSRHSKRLSGEALVQAAAARRVSEDCTKDDELLRLLSSTTRYSSRSSRVVVTRVRDPESYFDLMAGSQIEPEVDDYRKIDAAALREDSTLLQKDLCSAPTKGISFFVAVILHCLYVRRQSRNKLLLQFILFDGECSPLLLFD